MNKYLIVHYEKKGEFLVPKKTMYVSRSTFYWIIYLILLDKLLPIEKIIDVEQNKIVYKIGRTKFEITK